MNKQTIQLNGKTKVVSWEDLNEKYNMADYQPIDGKLVRVADHLAALMEADISIKHGITSDHLQNGRDGMLEHYEKNKLICGINVHDLFNNIIL